MANQATTTYKVTGSRKAVNDLWNTLQKMEVSSKNIWLYQLAELKRQKFSTGNQNTLMWFFVFR